MAFLWILLSAAACCCFGSNVRNASVTYDDVTQQFTVHNFVADNAIAYASFKDEIFLTGWSYLEVHSSESFPDPVQAYAAGLVEGYLTQDLISKHWNNLISDYCKGVEDYCQRLQNFIQKNLDFLNENIQARRQYDTYWHHVALILEQLHGVDDGFKNRTSKPSTNIEIMGVLMLNLLGDIPVLEQVLNKNNSKSYGRCSALVKILPNNEDVYFSHVTFVGYNYMLRVLKKYDLKLHTSNSVGSPVVPGHTCTFSAYPGIIFSLDDFYLLSSGLVAIETTNDNFNMSLNQYVTPNGTVLEWQRNLIANRLAKNGRQWTDIFGIMNSGTYNNQWMILDYNKFKPKHDLQDEFFYVLEQMPGHLHTEDMTDVLRKQTYWPSYNRPYFKDIFNLSGWQEQVDEHGDWFSYERAPRGLIFKRDQNTVKDIPSMMKLMRYNDFQNDPLSRCNCTPPYSAYNAISARSDLNLKNGTYPIPDLGFDLMGGTDLKLTTYELFKSLQFVAISGPTYDSLPPFQWSKHSDEKVKHEGHPDLWTFKPIIHKWQ